MAEISEITSHTKVRDLIFAFERQSSLVSSEEVTGRPRAKSTGNALSYKIFRQPKLEIHEISDIEKELVKVETHLNYYDIYDKETHVAFQEQLFDILTGIVTIDSQGDPQVIEKKKQFIEQTQKLAKVLNSKLPFDTQRRVAKKIYTVSVKKQEQSVIKNQEEQEIHTPRSTDEETSNNVSSELNSSNSILVQSDDFLQGDNSELKSVPADLDSSFLPSVKKLKAFFSFRKKPEDKPKASASINRSKSMLWKTKYAEEKNSEQLQQVTEATEEVVNENQPDVYVESAKEIEEYREDSVQIQNSVSVSKLKNIFEVKNKDTSQGLEIFAKKQTNSIAIPYTEMNLGAFRLKRSLSGSYMNYVGLLNNVGLNKSTSDLTIRETQKEERQNKSSLELNSGYSLTTSKIHDYDNEIEFEPYEVATVSEPPIENDKKLEIKTKSAELIDILDSSKSLSTSVPVTTTTNVYSLVSSIEKRSHEHSVSSSGTNVAQNFASSVENHGQNQVEEPSEYSVSNEAKENHTSASATYRVKNFSSSKESQESVVQVVEEPNEYLVLSQHENGNHDPNSFATGDIESSLERSLEPVIEEPKESLLEQNVSSLERNVKDKVASIESYQHQTSVVELSGGENLTGTGGQVQQMVSSFESHKESVIEVEKQVEHSHAKVQSIVTSIERRGSEIESTIRENGSLTKQNSESNDQVQVVPSDENDNKILVEEEQVQTLPSQTSVTNFRDNNGTISVFQAVEHTKEQSLKSQTITSTEHHYSVISSRQDSHNEGGVQIVEEPVEYSMLSENSHVEQPEDSGLSFTEENDHDINSNNTHVTSFSKVHKSILSENNSSIEKDIEDEIFKQADSVENVEEEFEKLVRENSN